MIRALLLCAAVTAHVAFGQSGRGHAQSATIRTLSGATDTSIVDPAGDQRLIYDAVTGKWTNAYEREDLVEVDTFVDNVYSITEATGAYSVHTATATGDVTITIPDASSANAGQKLRFILDDATHAVIIVTTSGQAIGTGVSLRIERAQKSVTLMAHTDSYLIVQDSRQLFPTDGTATTIVDRFQYTNFIGSSAIVSGLEITKNVAGGTISVSAGEAILRASAAGPTSELMLYAIPAATDVAVPDLTTVYTAVDYNAGSPVVTLLTDPAAINGTTVIGFGVVFRDGTTAMDVYQAGGTSDNFVNRWALRQFVVDPIARLSGSVFSTAGLRRIAVTAGAFLSVLSPASTPAIDTSVPAGNFTTYFRSGASTWTRTYAQTAVANSYNNLGTNQLVALGVAKYGVGWWYWRFNDPSRLAFVYGQAEYSTEAAAIAAAQQEPTIIPPEFGYTGATWLAASVYWQQSQADFGAVYNRQAITLR